MSFSINSNKPWSHPRVHSLEFSSKVRSFRQTKTFQKRKLPKYRTSLDFTQHSSLVWIKEEPKYSLFRVKTYGQNPKNLRQEKKEHFSEKQHIQKKRANQLDQLKINNKLNQKCLKIKYQSDNNHSQIMMKKLLKYFSKCNSVCTSASKKQIHERAYLRLKSEYVCFNN